MIYIYKGQGVSPLSFSAIQRVLEKLGYKTTSLHQKALKEALWIADAKLLIMPGGRDIPYCQALNGKGCRIIKTFVQNGGSYLGICAGAYFGSFYVEFNRGSKLEVLGHRELDFFPYKAIGPAFGNDTFSYRSHIGARSAKIRLQNGQEMHFFYDGGCFFEEAHSHALGFYADLSNSPVAIIEGKIDLGQVVLSGVHIECFFEDLNLDDPDLKKIAPSLKANENKHLAFLKDLIQKLTDRT